jgi:PAS domain S-box-containing protein
MAQQARGAGVDGGSRTRVIGPFIAAEVEELPFGVAVTDSHDRFVDVNQRLCEIVARSRGELLGQLYTEVVHPDDRSREVACRTDILSGHGSSYSLEERYVRSDGAVRRVTVRASAARFGQGALVRRILDVTDRRQAELDRDRFFAMSADALVVIGFDNAIRRANPASTQVLGWNEEELRSLNLVDLIHPDDREAAVQEFSRVMTGENVVNVETRIRASDGSYRWLSVSLTAFPDEQLFYVCARDVTARRLAQQALERSEERFRRLFVKSPLGLAVLDVDLCFLRVNTAYCDLVGYDEKELIGRNFADVTHPDDVAPHAVLARRMLAGEIPGYEFEKRYVRSDGEVIWGRLRATGLHEDDGTFMHLAMVEDITEIRQVERDRRELDALKDSFIRVVAHDLQNPLVAIAGLADVCLSRSADAEQALQRIRFQAQRLQHMVSTFLDLDRLYTNCWQPNGQPTDLGSLTRRVAGIVDLDRRPVTIDAEPVVAVVDPEHIERILENLLINAISHTPPGTPVWLRIAALGDDALLIVEDAGPGVPEDLRQQIFELFRTGDPGARRTGMGLWVVQRLAALHGGRVWVEDRPGGGASFRVLLPRCSSEEVPGNGKPVLGLAQVPPQE